MRNIPTLWFDKDGVLAQYDYALYEPEFGAPAPWTVRNAHVFKGLDTYENMVAAFRYLYENNVNLSIAERTVNVRVLTSVSDGLTLSEQVIDSAEWCLKHLGIKVRDFFATAVAKENIPIKLRHKITSYDILLDDYMPNLRAWKESGGTAIKVLNGINSFTEEFPCISIDMPSDDIVNLLLQTVENVVSEEDIRQGFYKFIQKI